MFFDLKEFTNEEGKVCVDYTHYFKLHFIKGIPFIQGKVTRTAIEECKGNWMERFPERVREELEIPSRKSNTLVPIRASEIPEFKTKSSMRHQS